MPIGKICGPSAGKGADYTAGSWNIDHSKQETGKSGKSEHLVIQKSNSQHGFGAGACNIQFATNVPKVGTDKGYSISPESGKSCYGVGAVSIEQSLCAPKPKAEGLFKVDRTIEVDYTKKPKV